VINATGIFSDKILRLDRPGAAPLTQPSQGVHLVFDRSFQPGENAIMVPHTDDGRVLFVIPWHDRVLVGTTDTPMARADLEPRALPEEIDFILRNANRYLTRDPTRADVLSVFAGQRPLVQENGSETKTISREHVVHVSPTGLVTVVGGKWTTYRKMAEDTLAFAVDVGGLAKRPCVTEELKLHGWVLREALPDDDVSRAYGTDLSAVEDLAREDPALGEPLHPRLPYRGVHIVWALRHEMARDVEDLLSRRTRALLLDARAAIECAPRVAALAARELGRDGIWEQEQIEKWNELATGYHLSRT
jgi:glycerol-3-phosphate dehydrogenase